MKLELQAANQHSNDFEKEIKCATQRTEDKDKRVMGALNYISKNLPGSVPSEFVDLINSHKCRDSSDELEVPKNLSPSGTFKASLISFTSARSNAGRKASPYDVTTHHLPALCKASGNEFSGALSVS
ncbi:uncharacterized protein G2W53_026209 [Senna tora]|uniref:Uncharacterized protein n=1 Tax=Senna tora TaxID=362788 RepID=A0A834TNH5_9FABA|nr:uncharacterized protein G2W53_026209 [Senna tora]